MRLKWGPETFRYVIAGTRTDHRDKLVPRGVQVDPGIDLSAIS